MEMYASFSQSKLLGATVQAEAQTCCFYGLPRLQIGFLWGSEFYEELRYDSRFGALSSLRAPTPNLESGYL